MNKNEIIKIKQEYESIRAKLSELTEDELEQVTGGRNTSGLIMTYMSCSACHYNTFWSGDFSGQTFDCPRCKEHTFCG